MRKREIAQLKTATQEKGVAAFDFVWTKDDQQLLTLVQKEPCIVCLDPQGKTFGSEEFSDFFDSQCIKGGSRLAFVTGGAAGLPLELKSSSISSPLFSLSRLTFTHQITRLVLIEQIYRALEIKRGSPYHK